MTVFGMGANLPVAACLSTTHSARDSFCTSRTTWEHSPTTPARAGRTHHAGAANTPTGPGAAAMAAAARGRMRSGKQLFGAQGRRSSARATVEVRAHFAQIARTTMSSRPTQCPTTPSGGRDLAETPVMVVAIWPDL